MPNWASWLGLLGTIGFGAISVIQFIREIINRRIRQNEQAHLQALGDSLAHLRLMCSEAIESGEIIKSDSTRQFVRQIGWGLLTAESNVNAIAQSFKSKKVVAKKSD